MINFLFFTLLFQMTSNLTPKWTIFIYINGDNDLDRLIQVYQAAVLETLLVAKPYRFNVAIQMDNRQIQPRRYYFYHDTIEEIVYNNEYNMADGQTLVAFIDSAVSKMGPSQHYALVIIDHGGAWKDICTDYHPPDHIHIPDGELATAFQGIKSIIGKLDIFYAFSCKMQTWEVQEELKNFVDITIAPWNSPTISWGPGGSYPCWRLFYLSALVHNPEISPESLAIEMARSYEYLSPPAQTFSAIRTSQINEISYYLNELANLFVNTSDSLKNRLIEHWLVTGGSGLNQWAIDLGDFVEHIKKDTIFFDPAVREIAAHIEVSLKNVLLWKIDTTHVRNMINFYHPQVTSRYEIPYDSLLSSELTVWDEYLKNNDLLYWRYAKGIIQPVPYFFWVPQWYGPSDTARIKLFQFPNSNNAQQVKLYFPYIDLAEGDSVIVYKADSSQIFVFTGKWYSAFTPVFERNECDLYYIEFRGQHPIPANCFCLNGLAYTTEIPSVTTEVSKEQKNKKQIIYPTIFRNKLIVKYSGEFEVTIYDVSGRVVKIMQKQQGRAEWKPERLPTGTYFVKIKTDKIDEKIQKVIYIK